MNLSLLISQNKSKAQDSSLLGETCLKSNCTPIKEQQNQVNIPKCNLDKSRINEMSDNSYQNYQIFLMLKRPAETVQKSIILLTKLIPEAFENLVKSISNIFKQTTILFQKIQKTQDEHPRNNFIKINIQKKELIGKLEYCETKKYWNNNDCIKSNELSFNLGKFKQKGLNGSGNFYQVNNYNEINLMKKRYKKCSRKYTDFSFHISKKLYSPLININLA